MKTKFNTLSDERYSSNEGIDSDGYVINLTWYYREEDVQKAVRLLKKDFEFEYGKEASARMKGIISERFGENLNGK